MATSSTSSTRLVLIISGCVAALALALFFGFYAGSPSKPAPVPAVADMVAQSSKPAREVPAAPPAPAPLPDAVPMPADGAPAPSSTSETGMTGEERIHKWLTETASTDEAAREILKGWPTLSEEDKVQAAPHLLNLLPDEQFGAVSKMLMDPTTNREVMDLFFADSLNRPDEIKWPLLVEVMSHKNHPLAQEARDILNVALGEDFGDDWNRWRLKVNQDLLQANKPPGN